MSDAEARLSRFCIRHPDCDGIAEPEEDGEVTYWKCARCEHEFGYVVVFQPDPVCQLNIPEAVRGAFDFTTTAPPSGSTSVFLGSTITTRRAEDDPGT